MRVQVSEVSSKGASTLIEWVDENGNLNRSKVPNTELIREEGQVFVEDPENGAPYGEAWEDLIRTQAGPKAIAGLLRQSGIWTYEDFLQNTAAVSSVFREACTANLNYFREAVHLRQVKSEQEEGKN